MNDRLLEILSARPDFKIAEEDRAPLEFFCEYLDRSSLFLSGFESGPDGPVLLFTNEAEHFRFSIPDIRRLVHGMKSGQPMDWESLTKMASS